MKVFYPLEIFYPSQAGGTANAVYWLAKHLVEKGFEPTVIATDKGLTDRTCVGEWLDTEAGRVIFVGTRSVHFPFKQTLLSLVKMWGSDIIHVTSVFYPAAFVPAMAARIFGKKLALSPHGELTEYALNHSAGRKRPILWALRKIVGRYPLFHSTSDEETENIKSIFGSDARIVQITNYVEIAPELPRTDGGYLLYIGRIHRKKAIDNLIRSLRLSETFLRSGLILKIAGEGNHELKRELESLTDELDLNEKVQFVGHVEGEEKDRLLANARFTLMPSHTENFGIVVLESLAQGTPVIASTNTPWSDLESEKIGIWTGNSPEELKAAIERFIEMEPGEYDAYRARGRGYVLRTFDMRNHIGEWVEFYENLRRSD